VTWHLPNVQWHVERGTLSVQHGTRGKQVHHYHSGQTSDGLQGYPAGVHVWQWQQGMYTQRVIHIHYT
jgi:hypothetical protein